MAAENETRERGGFFSKLKARLNRGAAWLKTDLVALTTRPLDAASVEELETTLLQSDVGVDATEWLVAEMKRRRRGGATAAQLLRETVTELLGTVEQPLAIDVRARPFVILVVGVNGTGKTTTTAKIAQRLHAEGHSVLLAAADTFRAAAVEQLKEWGRRIDVPVVAQETGADPAAVVHDALTAARARDIDVVLADTAGRLHTASGLMDELDKIKRIIKRFDAAAPHETLLVLDASQGQNALAQAQHFNERLGVTGVAITKLDGTAKGGILLALARKLRVPIRFVAVGEGVDDINVFRADEFARALIGE